MIGVWRLQQTAYQEMYLIIVQLCRAPKKAIGHNIPSIISLVHKTTARLSDTTKHSLTGTIYYVVL